MVKCDICQREFKTQQGLIGHQRFVHGIKPDKKAPLFPSKRFTTDEDLAKINKALNDNLVKQVAIWNERAQKIEEATKFLEKCRQEDKLDREREKKFLTEFMTDIFERLPELKEKFQSMR